MQSYILFKHFTLSLQRFITNIDYTYNEMGRHLVCFPFWKESSTTAEDSLTRYLLAVVVVLSGLLTALEYTTREDDSAYVSDTALDDVEDLELLPVVEMENAIAMVTPANDIIAKEIEVVDEVDVTDTLTAPIPDEAMKELTEDTPPLAEAPTTTEGIGEGNTSALTTLTVDQPLPMRTVEQLPEFPGGQAAFIDWLTKKLRHPAPNSRYSQKNVVLASFVVEIDGSVSNIAIVEPAAPIFNNEVLRVLKLMPKWKPGKIHAKTCRTLVHLPVQFRW